MFNKTISLTKASVFFFGLLTVLVFASSSWAAKVDVDNQSNCDVTVLYRVNQPQGLGANTVKVFDVDSGRTGFQDELAFWIYRVVSVEIHRKGNQAPACSAFAPEGKTYYHAKVVVTGDDENSLRCDITFH